MESVWMQLIKELLKLLKNCFWVPYIPYFSYNLISISKLVSSYNLELIFSSKSSITQGIKTKEGIGIVEVGLYAMCLQNNLSCCLNTTILNCIPDIWHMRIGHLSAERLEIMKRQYPLIIVVRMTMFVTLASWLRKANFLLLIVNLTLLVDLILYMLIYGAMF